jgi:hypothetical protein
MSVTRWRTRWPDSGPLAGTRDWWRRLAMRSVSRAAFVLFVLFVSFVAL